MRENPSGVFAQGTANDCHNTNCIQAPTPVWDATSPPEQGGNPSQDYDAFNGFGPENIDIPHPLPGRYKVLVKAYRATTTTARVSIFIQGATLAMHSRTLDTAVTWWDVGNVVYPQDGTAAVFVPVDQVE